MWVAENNDLITSSHIAMEGVETRDGMPKTYMPKLGIRLWRIIAGWWNLSIKSENSNWRFKSFCM